MKADTALALSARLRKQSYLERRSGRPELAADLRLASICCRRLAACVYATDAQMEPDPAKKRALQAEAASAWTGGGHD